MAPVATKRRRGEDEIRRPKKKILNFKKQKNYHSSSEDEDEEPTTEANQTVLGSKKTAQPAKPILKHKLSVEKPQPASDEDVETTKVDELELNTALNMAPEESSGEEAEGDVEVEDVTEGAAESSPDEDQDEGEDEDDEDDAGSESEMSTTSSNRDRTRKKRNDPTAFATSISKILDTKLSTAKRSDPVLSRSKSAADANKTLADEKLETKARAQIRAEKRDKLEKGRVRDVLGINAADVETGVIMEEEKRLKKTAQRGVVKLFNAVRAAQVKAETAMKQAKEEGVVGMQKREERVNEMSKQGFLDLISRGGKTEAMA